MLDEIDRPEVVAEVASSFADYDRALLAGDIDQLDHWFWSDEAVIRFGIAEELYGPSEIAAHRRAALGRVTRGPLTRTTITTFGQDIATVSVEFADAEARGRQTQTWLRLPDGWRVVCAHVSHRKV